MAEFNAIALFCEDIREEKGGTYTIVGIMGDNILVPSLPGAITKLGIYIRLHIPTRADPCKFDVFLKYPNGDRVKVNEIEESLVKETQTSAKKEHNSIAGIFTQLIASPFPVMQEGRVSVEIECNEQTFEIGGLNFMKAVDPADGNQSDQHSLA